MKKGMKSESQRIIDEINAEHEREGQWITVSECIIGCIMLLCALVICTAEFY